MLNLPKEQLMLSPSSLFQEDDRMEIHLYILTYGSRKSNIKPYVFIIVYKFIFLRWLYLYAFTDVSRC